MFLSICVLFQINPKGKAALSHAILWAMMEIDLPPNLDTGNGPRFGGIGLYITSPNAIRAFKTSGIMFIHV